MSYKNSPILKLDFTEREPKPGAPDTQHSTLPREENLLKPQIFNEYNSTFKRLVDRIWNDDDSIVKKIEEIDLGLSNISINKIFNPEILSFLFRYGIFDVSNVPTNISNDSLFKSNSVFDVLNFTNDEIDIDGGYCFITNKIIAVQRKVFSASDIGSSVSNNSYDYFYFFVDITSNEIQVSNSLPPANYILLYKIIIRNNNGIIFFEESSLEDKRKYINKFVFSIMQQIANSNLESISSECMINPDDITLVPLDSPITLHYDNNSGKIKINLSITLPLEINSEGKLSIKDGAININHLNIQNIFEPYMNIQQNSGKIGLNLSDQFLVQNNTINISNIGRGVISSDAIDTASLTIDQNSKLKVNTSYGISISPSGLTLDIDPNVLEFVANLLSIKVGECLIKSQNGLDIKNDSVTLEKLKKGTGPNDLKINSEGYALFY